MRHSIDRHVCPSSRRDVGRALRNAALGASLAALAGCAALGSAVSPYPEKFSCKNSDHGQCISPEQAYNDAVAGRASRSNPAVTVDKKLLRASAKAGAVSSDPHADHRHEARGTARSAKNANLVPVSLNDPYATYRDSLYREMQGLIDAPVTPMLRPPRTIRTLILPYADRERPDRLYMPRYVYSVLGGPVWVVGNYLVEPTSRAASAPVLAQVRETPAGER